MEKITQDLFSLAPDAPYDECVRVLSSTYYHCMPHRKKLAPNDDEIQYLAIGDSFMSWLYDNHEHLEALLRRTNENRPRGHQIPLALVRLPQFLVLFTHNILPTMKKEVEIDIELIAKDWPDYSLDNDDKKKE